MEEAELAEHRADGGHLEHPSLQGLVAGRRVGRQQLAALIGQMDPDGTGFEQGQRRVTGKPARSAMDGSSALVQLNPGGATKTATA